jgi:signal transduction histidine kinase
MADPKTNRRTTRVQQRAYDAFALSEFTSQLDELGIEQLTNYFAVTVCGQFGVPQVQIFLRDEAKLTLAACKGLDRREPPVLEISREMHDELVKNRQPRRLADIAASSTLAPLSSAFTPYWRPAVVFPMIHKSSLVGLCAISNRMDGGALSDYQTNLLSAMVSHVSLAIGNSHILEKVHETTRLLKDMDQERKALHESRDDFVRIACHEFNTPLTVINLTLDLLLDDKDAAFTAYQKGLIEEVRRNCERLAEIHQDLIALTQRRSGRLEASMSKCSFREVFHLALEKAQPLLERRPDLSLHISVPTELPEITADRDLLAKALVNVLQNAIKYTPETGGEITVDVSAKDDCIVCHIADNGIGIEPEYLDKVFEPFVELIDSRKRSSSKTRFLGAGLGLGLTIARDIVEKHGGKIWLTSQGKDTGTSVFLQIPAVSEHRAI